MGLGFIVLLGPALVLVLPALEDAIKRVNVAEETAVMTIQKINKIQVDMANETHKLDQLQERPPAADGLALGGLELLHFLCQVFKLLLGPSEEWSRTVSLLQNISFELSSRGTLQRVSKKGCTRQKLIHSESQTTGRSHWPSTQLWVFKPDVT